jgi:hypothetical protein
MKTFVIVADPAAVSGTFNKILKDNPKIKVHFITASHHILAQPQPAHIQRIGPAQQSHLVPVQCLYVAYTGIDYLVDENGKVIEGQ